MSRTVAITLPPTMVVALTNRFNVPHRITAEYAKLYVDHAKEETTLTDFVRRASDDVYPPKFSSRSQTAAFRSALRKEIRGLERAGRGGY